jgi:hypothetical protein
MKKIFAAFALLTIVASPALAATTHRHHPAANTMTTTETRQNMYGPGFGYYADGPTSTDPDPFIRRSLLIEGDHNFSD